jgi:hypothetical protein
MVILAMLAVGMMLSVPAPAEGHPARVERAQYKGWSVYRLTNGIITLLIAPDIGGRAIQLQLGEHEFFYVNPELAGKVLPAEENNPKSGWANYGGDKVWPAPQGWTSDEEWPGPPEYAIDGSRYQSEVVSESPEAVAVRVTGPPDPRTGIRFRRTFHVYAGTTRIKVEQTMQNVSRRRVRWGIWHVVQHDAASVADDSKPNPELYAYVPLNPHSRFPDGFRIMMGNAGHAGFRRVEGGHTLRVHYMYEVAKAGVDTSGGWLAVVNGQKNTCFVEEFPDVPAAEYPDGAAVEFWLNGPGRATLWPFDSKTSDDPKRTPYFLESEVLSPMAVLAPGEEYSYTVHWVPVRAPNPVRQVLWPGVVSEPLSAGANRGGLQLRGVFGVNTAGSAEAVFYAATGEELAREALGPVDPREVLRIDKNVRQPAGAFRVSVVVRDMYGQSQGALGNVVLAAPEGMK